MHGTTLYFSVVTISLGLGGVVAQSLLLKELFILFSGNELSFGIILGAWIAAEAGGAFAGGRVRGKNTTGLLVVIILYFVFSVILPGTIYAVRAGKLIMGIPPEISTGLLQILWFSLLILLPLGCVHGFLFNWTCRITEKWTEEEAAGAIGRVYVYEMAGTIAGGMALNYLLMPWFSSFQIAFGAGVMNCLAVLVLSTKLIRGRRWVLAAAGTLLAAGIAGLFGGWVDGLHESSVRTQWGNRTLRLYKNSLYQNLVVLQNGEQYSIFADGVPVVTIPVPDLASVEEFAHIPMLFHQNPRKVMVVGGGAGGVIGEILKHPSVTRIDYVEVDPELLRTIQTFPKPITEKELRDPRTFLTFMDGRAFVVQNRSSFDVVLLGSVSGLSLQGNRFRTVEFFQAVRAKLNPSGILALTVPGSMTYYSRELSELNGSILKTLKDVFPYSVEIPGETNLLLLSGDPKVQTVTADMLMSRLNERKIETQLIGQAHLAYRLDGEKRRWYNDSINMNGVVSNRDFYPSGLFYSLAYDSLLFNPSLQPLFTRLKGLKAIHFLAGLILAGVSLFFLTRRRRNMVVTYTLGTTGFAAMVLELLLILGFQICYGYVFYEVVALMTVFLAGMALAALAARRFLQKEGDAWRGMIGTELILVCMPMIVFFGLMSAKALMISQPLVQFRSLFFLLLFCSGFFAGAQFPLGARLYRGSKKEGIFRDEKTVGKTVGSLYAADLLGGWLGGFVGGFLFLPLFGLFDSCLVLVCLKLTSLALLATSRRT